MLNPEILLMKGERCVKPRMAFGSSPVKHGVCSYSGQSLLKLIIWDSRRYHAAFLVSYQIM